MRLALKVLSGALNRQLFRQTGNDPILVVTSADLAIADGHAFTKTLQSAIYVAANGSVVILGITPDRPEMACGYIKQTGSKRSHGKYTAAQFAEKPTLETAQSYIVTGEYTWNSGMFVLGHQHG
jgi:mannose-1-phosphate guanylyltransferase/mannose-6-phosphate isomerase